MLLPTVSSRFCLSDDSSQKLRLSKLRNPITVFPLGGKTSACTGTIDFPIQISFVNTLGVTAFVLSKLTQTIPVQNVNITSFDNHCNFVYADPHFQTRGRISFFWADAEEEIFPEKLEFSKKFGVT